MKARNSLVKLLVQQVKRPYLIVSVVLHGLFLFAPISSPPSADAPTTRPIKLTRLPLASKPTPVPPLKPSPIQQPSSPLKPSQSIPSSSVLPIPLSPPSPTVFRPSPASLSPSPPVTTAPTPSVSLSPSPSTDPSPSPSPDPSPDPSMSPDPLADFPHVAGAQAGCAGSERCWQTADTQWRSIAVTIQQDLKNKGYALESLPLADETGRQVYLVSKLGEAPYYLSFISTPQGTIYSSTERPMTTQEMNILAGL